MSDKKATSKMRRFAGFIIPGLSIGFFFPLIIGLLYVGIVLLLANPEKYGGGYAPFVLAGVITAIAGLVFTIAHIDKDLEESKQNLVRIGELYVLAAVALTTLGLFFPIYDGLAQPFAAYYIPFLLVILTLVTSCLLSCVATKRLIWVLWEKRKALFKGSLEK